MDREIDINAQVRHIWRTLDAVHYVHTDKDSDLATDLTLISFELPRIQGAIHALQGDTVNRNELLSAVIELRIGLAELIEHCSSALPAINLLEELVDEPANEAPLNPEQARLGPATD